VDSVEPEPDGDVHVLLRLPLRRSGLLNDGNFSDTHGDLVAEIICVGPTTEADAESACAGHVNHVAVPSAGERIRISGTYVLDAVHGWMEIHPVSRLSVLSAAAPVSPPSAPGAPAGCHPRAPSGNCYEPGEFCSAAEHGETGVAGDGTTITCLARGGYWRWEGRVEDRASSPVTSSGRDPCATHHRVASRRAHDSVHPLRLLPRPAISATAISATAISSQKQQRDPLQAHAVCLRR
jgi:hypothetical protein